MNNYSSTIEVSAAKEKVLEAQQSGKIADSAVTNIMTWLEDARYEKYRDGICQHIAEEQWQTLDE